MTKALLDDRSGHDDVGAATLACGAAAIATVGVVIPDVGEKLCCYWLHGVVATDAPLTCKNREEKTGEGSDEGVQHPKSEAVCGLRWLWRSLAPSSRL